MIKATDYIGALILENDTLQFIQTAEGRIVPKTVDGADKNEYQYHLKDHLGNVRTTFAVKDDDYPTDFEIDTTFHPYFDNYGEIERLVNIMKRSGNKSHRLLGRNTATVGLMKSLSVSKGDKVSAEVYGKYLAVDNQDDAINTTALVSALVNMLSGGVVAGETTLTSENLTGFGSAGIADDSDKQSPRAYLNYIMLDKNFNFVDSASGLDRLSTNAADLGDGSAAHEKLSFEEILIDQDGYLLVFLSNESQQPVDVYWDDFRVDHHYNAVLQADDYYPFGLTFNSYQRSYSKANNFKYNGKEEQEETGWYDYGLRQYDPELGVWHAVDPSATSYYDWSPYSYVFNNPIRLIDPDGADPEDNVTGNCCPGGTARTGRSNNRGRSGGNVARMRESVSNAASISRRRSGFATLSRREGTMFRKNVTYSTSRGNGLNVSGRSSGTNIGFSDNQHTFGTRAGGVAKVLNDIRGFAQNIVDNAETITVSESFTKAGGFDLSLGSDITVDNFQTTLQLKELETKFNEGVSGLARGEMSQEEFNELPMEEQSMRLNAARLFSGPSPLQIVNQAISNSEVVSEEREDLPSISPSN